MNKDYCHKCGAKDTLFTDGNEVLCESCMHEEDHVAVQAHGFKLKEGWIEVEVEYSPNNLQNSMEEALALRRLFW